MDVNQVNAFRAMIHGKAFRSNREMSKNSDDPRMSLHKVEAIFLAFQLWAPMWQKQQLKVYTDSTTAYSGLWEYTFKGLAHAPLQKI